MTFFRDNKPIVCISIVVVFCISLIPVLMSAQSEVETDEDVPSHAHALVTVENELMIYENNGAYYFLSKFGDRVNFRLDDDNVPYFELNRWDGEASLTLNIELAEDVEYELEEGKLKLKVKWEETETEFEFEPLDIGEGGGLEFSWTFESIPPNNSIFFPIQTENLVFYYQPPLTQQEIDAGCIRPENVVGSYAVYHSSKMNNEYKTGKAFHIYRPKAFDSVGSETWCNLNVDEELGVLTVTVPQEFLDSAVYPIVVDPIFGSTSDGTTTWGLGQMIRGSSYTITEGGTANTLTARFEKRISTNNAKVAIYLESDDSKVDYAETHQSVTVTAWYEFTLDVQATLVADTAYYLMAWSDASGSPPFNDVGLYYDTTGGSGFWDAESYGTWPDTISPTYHNTYKFSIYCTYTPVAAEEWQLIETWTGTVDAPADWEPIETWTDIIINTSVIWTAIATWTATIGAPGYWNKADEWDGDIGAPASWKEIDTWTGTINSPAGWSIIEQWSGTIDAPASWKAVDEWTGTLNAPAVWKTVGVWTGTVNAQVSWREIDTWSGTVTAPYTWNAVDTWTGTVNAPVGWNVVDTWSGTINTVVSWNVVDEWTGIVNTLVEWNVIDTWNVTIQTLVQWVNIEVWGGNVNAPASWTNIDEWTGIVNTPVIYVWRNVAIWTGTINAPVSWTNIDEWSGTIATPTIGIPMIYFMNINEIDNTLTVEWENAENATTHHIQIDNENIFISFGWDNSGLLDNTFIIPLPDYRIFIRVRGEVRAEVGPWSDVSTLSVGPEPGISLALAVALAMFAAMIGVIMFVLRGKRREGVFEDAAT